MAIIKNKIISFKNGLLKSDNALEWISVGVIVLFSMFTMFYSDFQGTMDFAYQTVRQVMNGGFGGVPYLFSHPYGMTVAILLMIWMLPFYPFTLLAEGEFWYFGSLAAAVWSKLLLSTLSAFCIIGICKIAKLIGVNERNRKWLPIFFITSAFYFMPVVEIGQCDIISLTFMVWGIYYYLNDDIKKFVIFFAIAIPMKYFALFIFIPLVFLREKNPLKIILQGIGGGSILAVNLLIRKKVYGSFLGDFTSNTLSKVVGSGVESSTETTDIVNNITVASSNAIEDYFGKYIANSSLFIVVFILICILAYAINKNHKQWAIYIPCMVYTLFITLSLSSVYWSVLIIPFLTLVIFSNDKQLRLSMILETIVGWVYMYMACYSCSWVVGGEYTFSYLFLRNKVNGAEVHTFLEYEMGIDGLMTYANSIYVAGIIGLLLLNIPCLVNNSNDIENTKFDRWIIWGRIAILYVWVALLVYLMIIR